MAKIVGFGQTGFVARMQKASLFGYEPYGRMERQYSPYAGVGALSFHTDEDYKALDAEELAAYNSVQQYRAEYSVAEQMQALDVMHNAYVNSPSDWQSLSAQKDAIVAKAAEIQRTIATGGGRQIPAPPPGMAASCAQQLIWDGQQWYCPDKPAPVQPVQPVQPTGGGGGGGDVNWEQNAAFYQLLLSLVNNYTRPGSLGGFGKFGSGDIDGRWGKRSIAAIQLYARLTGTSGGQDTWNALGAEVSGRPELANDAARAAYVAKVNGKSGAKVPSGPPQPQPQQCPPGTTGTYPNCKQKPNIAGMVAGGALITLAVGILAAVALRREG